MHAHAQTDNAGVTCEVIAPSVIERTTDLSFGRFSAAHGGTVTVGIDGARTSTGAVTLVMSEVDQTAARIDLRGEGAASFTTTLSTEITAGLLGGSGQEIPVRLFTDGSGDGNSSGDEARVIRVGATLTLAPDPTPGDYVGRFTVTVEYN